MSVTPRTLLGHSNLYFISAFRSLPEITSMISLMKSGSKQSLSYKNEVVTTAQSGSSRNKSRARRGGTLVRDTSRRTAGPTRQPPRSKPRVALRIFKNQNPRRSIHLNTFTFALATRIASMLTKILKIIEDFGLAYLIPFLV